MPVCGNRCSATYKGNALDRAPYRSGSKACVCPESRRQLGLVVAFLAPVDASATLGWHLKNPLAADGRTGAALEVYEANADRYHLSVDLYIGQHRRRRQTASRKGSRALAAAVGRLRANDPGRIQKIHGVTPGFPLGCAHVGLGRNRAIGAESNEPTDNRGRGYCLFPPCSRARRAAIKRARSTNVEVHEPAGLA